MSGAFLSSQQSFLAPSSALLSLRSRARGNTLAGLCCTTDDRQHGTREVDEIPLLVPSAMVETRTCSHAGVASLAFRLPMHAPLLES